MTVLVTGGAGYIGSHTVVELLEAGYDVVVVDNLCNSNEEALRRVQEIANKTLTFYPYDVRDKAKLEEVFSAHPIDWDGGGVLRPSHRLGHPLCRAQSGG